MYTLSVSAVLLLLSWSLLLIMRSSVKASVLPMWWLFLMLSLVVCMAPYVILKASCSSLSQHALALHMHMLGFSSQ